MSSPTLALRAQGGASSCERLTSETENVPGSIDVAVMDHAAFAAEPLSYFETCATFKAADRTAAGTDLSAEVLGDVHKRRCARHRLIPQPVA